MAKLAFINAEAIFNDTLSSTVRENQHYALAVIYFEMASPMNVAREISPTGDTPFHTGEML